MKWIRFFWSFVATRKDLGVALLVCSVVVAAAELTIPWLIQQAIDLALGEADGTGLNKIMLTIIGVIAVLYVMHVLLLRVEFRMLYEASYKLRQRLYKHFHSQSLAFFQRHKTGKLLHRVTSDALLFEENVVEIFSGLPFELLTSAGVLTLMALIDVRLTGFVVLFLLIASAITGYVGRPLPTLRKTIQSIAARLTARLHETLAGVKTVQAFKNERYELNRLDETNRAVLDADIKEGRVEAWIDPVFDLMELLGVVLAVWYGSHLIISKQITVGQLVAFMAYMEILAGPVSQAGKFYTCFQTTRAVGERLQDLLDDTDTLAAPRGEGRSGDVSHIIVENVSFRHPQSSRQVLRDISFTVKQGETVAIVGRNGAGKSTLLDLFLRFYDPLSGRIVAGDIDLRDWDLDAWRNLVGVMTQDIFLFHATIAENIGYGRPESGREEIELAARTCGIEPLIRGLPKGIDTAVGERGAKLSGGQRQMVALARLFLRNAPILILDEPTAHLDGETLSQVGAALKQLMVGRTTFLVAHRSETVRLASRIIVLDKGRIVGEGTHEALLADHTLYRKLMAEMGLPLDGLPEKGRRPAEARKEVN